MGRLQQSPTIRNSLLSPSRIQSHGAFCRLFDVPIPWKNHRAPSQSVLVTIASPTASIAALSLTEGFPGSNGGRESPCESTGTLVMPPTRRESWIVSVFVELQSVAVQEVCSVTVTNTDALRGVRFGPGRHRDCPGSSPRIRCACATAVAVTFAAAMGGAMTWREDRFSNCTIVSHPSVSTHR
jgi:hypothetical protein